MLCSDFDQVCNLAIMMLYGLLTTNLSGIFVSYLGSLPIFWWLWLVQCCQLNVFSDVFPLRGSSFAPLGPLVLPSMWMSSFGPSSFLSCIVVKATTLFVLNLPTFVLFSMITNGKSASNLFSSSCSLCSSIDSHDIFLHLFYIYIYKLNLLKAILVYR